MHKFVFLFLASMLLLLSFFVASVSAQSPTYLFGTLQSDPSNTTDLQQKGVRVVTVSLSWRQYEPFEGQFNQNYINQQKQLIQTFRNSGQEVVLGFGVQYPPDWIFTYPHSRYVNQHGDAYITSENGKKIANMVFNQTLREKQARYIERVFQDLGTDFLAVRLGGGWYGELNYPPTDFNGKTNSYWAYDNLAQGSVTGLPPGISVAPLPGWRPGTPSPNTYDASQFINWYLNSLKDYHDWQIQTVSQHYPGKMLMLYPSWGVRPGQIDEAVVADLNGSTSVERNNELQRGFDFERFVQGIQDPNVILYTTWLDAPFGDDSSTNIKNWSPPHFLRYLADNHPLELEVWGENTGQNSRVDMQRSFERMVEYRLKGIVWAFEPQLYSGSYATANDFGELIAEYVPGTFVTPTFEPTSTPEVTLPPTPPPTATPATISCLSADITEDGKVNFMDYHVLVSNFFAIPILNFRADIDGNGQVNLFDYSLLVQFFGQTC